MKSLSGDKGTVSLNCKEIKPVSPKGNQPWIFIARTGTETEDPKLQPPDVTSRLNWKRPWCWKDWRQEKKERKRMRCLDGISDSMIMNLSKLWEIVKDRKAWHATVHGVTKSQTRLSEWTRELSLVCFVWIFSFVLLFTLSSCPVLIHDFLELGSISKDLYIPIPHNFYTDLCKTGVFWVSETFFSSFQLAALD